MPRARPRLAYWCALALLSTPVARAEELVQLDPFAQATRGHPRCNAPAPPRLTREQVERGTRCAMEGKCEPGGAYRRDPGINDAVRAAIAADDRLAGTSIWLANSRGWVTLQGCVRDTRQRAALVQTVRKVPRVALVFDETRAVRVNPPQRRPVS